MVLLYLSVEEKYFWSHKKIIIINDVSSMHKYTLVFLKIFNVLWISNSKTQFWGFFSLFAHDWNRCFTKIYRTKWKVDVIGHTFKIKICVEVLPTSYTEMFVEIQLLSCCFFPMSINCYSINVGSLYIF